MPTNPPLFKGELGRKWFYQQPYSIQQTDKETFAWACSVKPGDPVNCCDYWNRIVESVEHTFATVIVDPEFGLCVGRWVTDITREPNAVWLETTFHFTDGHQHSTRGGCAVPAWTAEQVREHKPNCDERGCKPEKN
jgi:hypothetical protein